MYWAQGFDDTPHVVKKCVESWQHYNPDYEIRCIDDISLDDYIDMESWLPNEWNKPSGCHKTKYGKGEIRPAHKSDIVRLLLLEKYGGVYVDATVWCNMPLNNWLHNHTEGGFFAFSNPNENNLIANWFIASVSQHYLVCEWLKNIKDFWRDTSADDEYEYFVHQNIFKKLYESDNDFRYVWDLFKKIDVRIKIDVPIHEREGCHYFVPYNLWNLQKGIKRFKVDSKTTQMYKLTQHRIWPDKRTKELQDFKVIQYLFNTIKTSDTNDNS